MSVEALWYDGSTPRARRATLAREGAEIVVRSQEDTLERRYRAASCDVDPRLGSTRRSVRLPDGSECHVDDNDALDRVFAPIGLEARVERLERRWLAAGTAALIAVGVALFGAFFALPWAAERLARHVPASVERAMGRQVETLLGQFGFEPSRLPSTRRDALTADFARMVESLGAGRDYRLKLMRPGQPNAFALPGGTVVLGDELVEALGNDDEAIAAVLAHELGHLEHRHVLRSVLQDSALLVAITFMTGDVGSAGALTAAIPTFLVESHYSRGFETEADTFAFELLARTGRSPAAFARAMRALEQATPEDARVELGYLSSHPPTAERIARAEAAAR